MEPRKHIIHMKYLLARLMLTEPEETFALYREADGGVFLLRLWEHVASDLPELDRIPGKGLSIWYRPEGEESEAVVLTFPPPRREVKRGIWVPSVTLMAISGYFVWNGA